MMRPDLRLAIDEEVRARTNGREVCPSPARSFRSMHLTETELLVLQQAAAGLDTKESAAAGFRELQTVKFHRTRIFQKLDAKNIAHAVAIGYQRGILRCEQTEPREVVIDGVLYRP